MVGVGRLGCPLHAIMSADLLATRLVSSLKVDRVKSTKTQTYAWGPKDRLDGASLGVCGGGSSVERGREVMGAGDTAWQDLV